MATMVLKMLITMMKQPVIIMVDVTSRITINTIYIVLQIYSTSLK